MNNITFEILAEQIKTIHQSAKASAVGVINRMMTLRNWLIGYYIVEFEQHGEERAQYGDKLLKKLEERIDEKGLNNTLFKNSRRFYLTYPQVGKLFANAENTTTQRLLQKSPMASDLFIGLEDAEISPMVSDKFMTDPETLVSRLSFSHIVEIIPIKDSFAFEFLGLDAKETVDESDIEQALMDHLTDFLLEMGRGFCFEARQKRIIIDDEYFFIDLVLYNRILHCNVIIELKDDKFTHENLGQLNAYVAYYKENEMTPGDNPPVGILLCTQKGPKMVEYALAGMDNNLFVSTYMLQLPDKERLKDFLLKQMEEMGR